ncbi:hypothetical protein Plhal304r1_c031g0101651 [Plasmopara halstedii]
MRVSFLQFFEQNLQRRLVATIPPEVVIANHTAETTMLIELQRRSTRGTSRRENLPEPQFEWIITPALVGSLSFSRLPEKATADAWHGKTIRFKHANLKLIDPDRLAEDDLPTNETLIEKREKHALNYQIRMLTHDLTAFE